jgi:DNA-directed RNA polymerase subunit RPC12/RpoP
MIKCFYCKIELEDERETEQECCQECGLKIINMFRAGRLIDQLEV